MFKPHHLHRKNHQSNPPFHWISRGSEAKLQVIFIQQLYAHLKTLDAKHESNQTTASNASLSILTNPLPLAQSPTISECEDGEDGEDRNHQVKRRNNLLSEFKRMDVQCRQQRLLLNQLKDHQRKLIMDGLLFTRRNQRSAAGDSAVSTATGSTGSLAVMNGGSRIRTRELDLPFKRSYPPNRVSRLFAGKPKLKFSAQGKISIIMFVNRDRLRNCSFVASIEVGRY
jgi:hypothetical protein